MAIQAIAPLHVTPTNIPGMYTFSRGVSDVGDATGGSAILTFRVLAAAETAPMLWYYITQISFQQLVTTAQNAQIKIDPDDWADLPDSVNLVWGLENIAQGVTQGGVPLNQGVLNRPIVLGQPTSETNADIDIETPNTDTMTTFATIRGFATQRPIPEGQFALT